MAQYYTIQFAEKTGFVDNFGNVSYNVKFENEMDAVLMSINPEKTKLEDGMKIYGRIDNVPTKANPDKTYRKFIREQPDDQPSGAPAPAVQKKKYSETQSEKQDSIQQGMWINNAAAYLAAAHKPGDDIFDADSWSDKVREYAAAGYGKGALNPLEAMHSGAEPAGDAQPVSDDDLKAAENGNLLEDIDKIFPGSEPINPEQKATHVQLEQ